MLAEREARKRLLAMCVADAIAVEKYKAEDEKLADKLTIAGLSEEVSTVAMLDIDRVLEFAASLITNPSKTKAIKGLTFDGFSKSNLVTPRGFEPLLQG